MTTKLDKHITLSFLPNKECFDSFLKKRLETVGLYPNDVQDILNISLNNTCKRLASKNSKYNYVNKNTICIHVANNAQMCLIYYELSRNAYLKSIQIDILTPDECRRYKLIADSIYYLNIADTSVNLIYSNKLPIKLHCEHSHGSIVGNSTFTDKSSLLIYQQCTIGGNINLDYPNIDGDLIMYANTLLLGNTQIKGTVILSYGTSVYDAGLIENKIVFGKSPNLIFKDIKKNSHKPIFDSACFSVVDSVGYESNGKNADDGGRGD